MSAERKIGEQKKQEEDEVFLDGDVLESVFSQVPLIDLVSACQVSKPWNSSVFSSLRHLNRIKPWLIVHTQSTRSPYGTTMNAFDPRSDVWVELSRPPMEYVSALRSSHSTLLYMLSPSKFSFSVDPLHLKWHQVDAPRVWRTDPILASVGQVVVVAGGVCEFEDDPLAVEMYDVESGTWETCESMPAIMKESAASTWVSVAANSEKMYVAEKISGLAYTFDSKSKTWEGPYHLRPQDDIVLCAIGFLEDGQLVLVGMLGDEDNVKDVKIWEVTGESLDRFREMGVMPRPCLEKLKEEDGFGLWSSIAVDFVADVMYVHNPRQVVVGQIVNGVLYQWRSIRNVVADNDRSQVAARSVVTCSKVSIGDLHRALSQSSFSFSVTEAES